MTDTMLFGILKMPFEMAMKDEISRIQFYGRVQELVGRFEAQQQAEPVLQEIEQYRMQMAGISTAAIGYWKEGDGIHPDYDTLALRDVAKLYAKYDELYKAQPEQQAEPVVQAVIAGALFDFMGWLTTRKERLILSSTDNASPAVESITEFAKMRGLSLDDARVQDWQNYTTQQQAEPPPEWLLIKNILDEYGLQAIDFVAEFKAAQQVVTIWKQPKQQAPFSPEVINTTQTAWKMGYEAAKAEQQAEPTCPDCKAAVLYECVACSSNNYPPKQQAEPVQERITHITWDERGVRTVNGIPDDSPRRKELSASEILNMMPSAIPAEYDGPLMEFARAIEAAHNIKENT